MTKLELDVSWWVRPLMKLGMLWVLVTGRGSDYQSMTNFAVRHGMKIRVIQDAA